nr:hypothetical protein [Tanacetum cinerariifolium]
MWARHCRPGRYHIQAFPFDFSQATCRPGNVSPSTSRPGFPEIVAGETGKCWEDQNYVLTDNWNDGLCSSFVSLVAGRQGTQVTLKRCKQRECQSYLQFLVNHYFWQEVFVTNYKGLKCHLQASHDLFDYEFQRFGKLAGEEKKFFFCNNMQTQTSNTLHNAIMEAGSKDRPPMLAPGIDNDIYSTVDACPNAYKMWKAIERLKQEIELECAKVRGDFLSYKMESQKSCNKYTQTINDLNQTISKMKSMLSAHQDTIAILSKEKEAQIKLYKTREDKELEKVIELENKVKVLDNIVYKTGQSVQTMNMLNNKCRTSFAKPKYLKKAKRANPPLYDIGCYNDNLALMLAPESDEVIRLEKESRSKLSDLIKPFDYTKLNNLYDLFVPQREKSSEQHRFFSKRSRISHINVQNEKKKESFQKQTTLLETRMDKSIPVNKNCQSSLEIVNIKMNLNTIITGVELCKQKIANRTYFGHIDPFIQNTIEQNFCPVITKINVGLQQFLKHLNEEMVVDLRYFNSLELEVDSLTSQLETQKTQFVNEIDRLSREYYYADHMNAILGVYTDLDEVTNLQCDYLELLQKCECLETELSKSKM